MDNARKPSMGLASASEQHLHNIALDIMGTRNLFAFNDAEYMFAELQRGGQRHPGKSAADFA
jgi:triacylglycerol esterase/lipase EstA (alpha/beta hydrolase family)